MNVTKQIYLVPVDSGKCESDNVRKCLIKRINNDVEIDQHELWFELNENLAIPDYDDCDAYILAIIMDAMKEGRDLIVKGNASITLLSNLIEYQGAWNNWLPDTYSIVDIKVDTIRQDESPVPGAICAFSGGVDATFSVWRHSQSKASYRTQDIKYCFFIHGFDIPLKEEEIFKNAYNKAKTTLDEINIKLVAVRTNFRDICKADWLHVYSCALVSLASNYKLHAGTCIIGSSEPYNSLVIPLGSSPITDHLLSSGDLIVMLDGAAFSRTEKVKEISNWQTAVNNLRVCWEGTIKDRNCGKCEKCLRTKINFLASGNDIPPCFDDYKQKISLKKIKFIHIAVYKEWSQIYDYAIRHNVQGYWLRPLERVTRRSLMDHILPRNSYRRKVSKYILQKIRNIF